MGQQTVEDELQSVRRERYARNRCTGIINLQFAYGEYDLPWNPIRIDQRMGRLHRYGRDRDVHIQPLR